MLALISDIHGNLEALNAVCAKVDGLEIMCLGDVVGYGPDSLECVRKSAAWKSTIAGPFDSDLLNHDSNQSCSVINRMIEQLRRRFDESPDSGALDRILESYGAELAVDGKFYFHGGPGNVRDWIFPEEVYCPVKLNELASHPEHALIGGGTHLPGIFRKNQSDWEFTLPENGEVYDLPRNEKTIITLGSVGQPRDGDPRAAYAMVDDTSIVFHRVDYDIETTRQKIYADPDIDDMQGNRLLEGR